eukprot:3660446-Rhodomonas_salina.4
MDEGLRERLLDEKEQGTADSRAGAEDGLNPETSVDDWDEAEDGRPKRSSLDGDQVELDTLGDTPMDGSSGVPWNLIFAMVLVAIAVTTWVAEIEVLAPPRLPPHCPVRQCASQFSRENLLACTTQVTKNALGNTPDKYDNYYAVIWAAHMFSGLVASPLQHNSQSLLRNSLAMCDVRCAMCGTDIACAGSRSDSQSWLSLAASSP